MSLLFLDFTGLTWIFTVIGSIVTALFFIIISFTIAFVQSKNRNVPFRDTKAYQYTSSSFLVLLIASVAAISLIWIDGYRKEIRLLLDDASWFFLVLIIAVFRFSLRKKLIRLDMIKS